MAREPDTETLHGRIVAEIEGKIVAGAWPPGFRLPIETQLAAQHGCSRMTANKALTQLAKAGLIERRRKGGSFVRQPRTQSAVLEIPDIRTEVESLKQAYAHRLRRRLVREAGTPDRLRLAVPPDADVIELVCLHLAEETPFCLEQRLISLATVPEATDADFEAVPPGPWLLQRVPWSAAEHTIRAVAAERDVAAALRLPRGTPCLAVERRTWNDAGPITHVRLTYPGERHALVARFAPSS